MIGADDDPVLVLVVTEDLGNRGIAIPFSSVMTEDQVETVCQVLAEVLHAAA